MVWEVQYSCIGSPALGMPVLIVARDACECVVSGLATGRTQTQSAA